jgi:hypothetical protein
MGKIKQSTNQVWVYMDDGMKGKLHRMASQDKVNMSEFVRRLVNREIQRRKDKCSVDPLIPWGMFAKKDPIDEYSDIGMMALESCRDFMVRK